MLHSILAGNTWHCYRAPTAAGIGCRHALAPTTRRRHVTGTIRNALATHSMHCPTQSLFENKTGMNYVCAQTLQCGSVSLGEKHICQTLVGSQGPILALRLKDKIEKFKELFLEFAAFHRCGGDGRNVAGAHATFSALGFNPILAEPNRFPGV
jgi:hypothetical protein